MTNHRPDNHRHEMGPAQPNGPQDMDLPGYYQPSDHGYELTISANIRATQRIRTKEQH